MVSAVARPGSTGAAGALSIDADTDTIADPGAITANALGAGGEGGVRIDARDVTLVGAGRISASTKGSDHAGSITVDAGDALVVADNGLINASTSGAGRGDIAVQARAITLRGLGIVHRGDHQLPRARPTWGSAGNIKLNASDVVEIEDTAQIEASTLAGPEMAERSPSRPRP